MFTNCTRSVGRRSVDGHELRNEVVTESSREDVDVALSEPAMLPLDGRQVAADEVARRPTAALERTAGRRLVDVSVSGSETADRDDEVRRDDQQQQDPRRRRRGTETPTDGDAAD